MINESSNPVVVDTIDNNDENVFNSPINNKYINQNGRLVDTTNYKSPVMKYTGGDTQ